MEYKARIGNRTYHFESIKEVMAKANEKKSGDEMAGLAAENDSERVAAKGLSR